MYIVMIVFLFINTLEVIHSFYWLLDFEMQQGPMGLRWPRGQVDAVPMTQTPEAGQSISTVY